MNESPATVLIVDDAPDVRETLAALLSGEGYNLVFAADGRECLIEANRVMPDAILLDVMMPGMDGFEVCRRLRADPDVAEIPVTMITALDDRRSRLEGLRAGADEFLTKPFDRLELVIRLATISRLGRYRRLLEERTKLAQVVELAPDGMLGVDADGLIRLVNPALGRITGIAAHAEGSPSHFSSIVPPDHFEVWQECFSEVSIGAVPHKQFESVLRRQTGSPVPVEVAAGPFVWQDGPGVLFMIRDITERKRAELLEVERRQIASELHDGLAQMVTATYQRAQVVAHHYRPRTEEGRRELESLCALARESVSEVRRVLAGLRPTALDDFGLAAALHMQCQALKIEGWEITYDEALEEARLSPVTETALFRCAQEALNNVRKHALTTKVHVALWREERVVHLAVQDWGCGFDPSRVGRDSPSGQHLGLRTMRDRIGLLGGTLSIVSEPGVGTKLSLTAPFLPSDAGVAVSESYRETASERTRQEAGHVS